MSNPNQEPKRDVTVHQQVDTVSDGGKVVGVDVASQVADTIVNQTVVDRRVITNNILSMNDPQVLDALVAKLANALGVNKAMLQQPPAGSIEPHVIQQIDEVSAAQQAVAAQGLAPSAQALYELGMLMAYRRNLDAALDYFRKAAQAEPELSDAHEGIAWLQTARSLQDLSEDNAASAWGRLTEARAEIERADQSGARVQSFAGYIAQHAADAAERLHQDADAQRLRAEAIGTFEQAARHFPDDPSVLNGLAGSYASLGDYDGAIRSYERVIKLAPDYPQAFHDLAVAYEDKRGKDSAHANQWCAKAIAAWKEFVRLAPSDPTITEAYVGQISQRVLSLERECAPAKPRRKNTTRR